MSNPNQVVVSQVNDVTTVEITTAGPQGATGPQGPTGSTTFSALTDTPANLVANKFLKVNSSANAIEYADESSVTNLSYTPSTRVLASSSGDNATLPLVDTTNAGLLSASDKSKLDGIETSATADQTDSEIKTAYENNSNTNAYTDAEKTKLTGIESNATADQTDAEIRAAVEAATDSNVFTDADHTKLNGIEAGATADQTNAEIKTAYEANSDTNAFTDADHSKLDGIEASADVTDATNVDAAGAVMNTDSTTASMSFVVDEDNMSSDSATKVPTQQSVKAYVDTEVTNMVTTTGSQTLTNKSIDLDNNTITNIEVDNLKSGVLDTDLNSVSSSDDTLASAKAIKSYVDANSSDTTYTAGTGLSLSGTTFNVDQIALTTVQTAANESAHLALTTQEGDIVVRSDQNKSYVRNSGTAGTMADFTELLTPTDQVLSVNGNTGAITAAQIAAAVEAATDSNTFTDADHTKLNGIEASATADQTASEIKTLLQSNKLTVSEIADDAITADKLANSINSEIAANTAKVTNATHTGDVTGSTALTIADDAVTYAKMQNVSATDRVLGRDSSGAGVVEEITPANLRTMINVEDGATADQTAAEIRSLVDSASDSNVFTDADHSKLNGIEATADVTDATNVDAAGAVMNSDLDGKGELLVGDGSGDPTALPVGTNGYVLKANSSTATGLEWSAAGSGGDTNQNAFSNVAVSGQDTLAADSTTDTLNIAAGSNVTITTNASNDTVTIASTDTNTTYSVGDGGLTQNNFTDALKTKLDGIEASATADQTASEIVALVADQTIAPNTIQMADSEKIELGDSQDFKIFHDGFNAFVQDTGTGQLRLHTSELNVVTPYQNSMIRATPAGSIKLYHAANNTTNESDTDEAARIKLETSSTGITVSGSLTADSSSSNAAIIAKGDGSSQDGYIQLNCSQNSHGVKIASPPHSANASYTLTLPNTDGNADQVLKTDGSGGLDWVDQSGGGLNSDAKENTLAGTSAGSSVSTSAIGYNSFFGYQAGKDYAGTRSTAVGHNALKTNYNGGNNTAIGTSALEVATGSQNTAVGANVALSTTSGGSNTYVGSACAYNSTTASDNTSVGMLAFYANTTGSGNATIGKQAGRDITTGSDNTLVGTDAGNSGTNDLTTGSNNILIGHDAAASSATVSNEVTIGDANIDKFRIPGIDFILKDNGGTPTEGHVLTVDANGEAGFAAASGGGGGLTSDSDKNTVGGTNAGDAITAGQGVNNTLIGYDAGTSITTGDHSTALGKDALKSVTTAYGNMGIGRSAGDSLTTGGQNTIVGLNAGHSLTTQSKNVCMGEDAMAQTKGENNTSVGYQSMGLAYFGDFNTALGSHALRAVGGTSDGSGGDYNVAIGYQAGDALETGNNNIIIGYNAAATSDSTSNEITLGNTDITKFRIPGIDVVLKDNGGTPTEGHVLTVDSNGEAGFAAASGGGVTVQEEGSSLSTSGSTLNFVGNLITASGSGDTKTITVAGDWDVSKATTNNNKATVAGYQAGSSLSEGSTSNVDHGEYVTLYGHQAGKQITSAHNLTAIGYCLKSVTTGTGNSGLGAYCLTSCTTGGYNTGIGAGALEQVTSSSNNVGVGHQAGAAVTTGSNNIFLGEGAGFTGTNNLTTGSNNILIGYDAVASSATVSNEVTIGNSSTSKFRVPGINVVLKDNGGTPTNGHVLTVDANGEAGFAAASSGGLSSDSDNNTIGGTNAGDAITSGQGTHNTLIGYNAGTDLTTADGITAFGSEAAANVTTGSSVTAIGFEACKATKDSYENTGIGYNALKSADNAGGEHTFYGSLNVAVGAYALEDVTVGRGNTGIGTDALKAATTPNYNTAVGHIAMAANTTGGENTCVGAEAGQYISTGQQNTMIGYRALFAVSGTYLTGDNNTCLGYKAKPSAGNVSNEVTIGNTDVTKFRIPGLNSFEINDSGQFSGVASTASGTAGVRVIYASTSAPSGGADGDIWIKYTA
jgi:hypothetical protein